MINKSRKYFILLFIFSIIVILSLSLNSNLKYNDNNFGNFTPETFPKTQAFSLEDFTPLIEEKQHGLGNITITNITFYEEGIFNYTSNYPELDDDLTSGALNMTYNGTSYVNTTKIAQSDNLDPSIEYSDTITITLNESVQVSFDTSIGGSEGFLIYKPILAETILKKYCVQNESSSFVEEVNSDDYSVDSKNFLFFNYSDYFSTETNHIFTMYLIFEYNISIDDWDIIQDQNYEVVIIKQEQTIKPKFEYNFTVEGYKINVTSLEGNIPAENLNLAIKVNPPDRDLLFNHTLAIDEVIVNNFLDIDKAINATINANLIEFNLNFSTNYLVRFEDPIDFSWAIDRLVEGRDLRQRIYFPTIVSGPEHIYLSELIMYEPTITVEQVTSNSSLFERDVLYTDANLSVIQEHFQHSLIFTENAVRKKGLKITLPYLFKGETNPVFIKYRANNDLLIIITDSIRMPILGLELELYYYGKLYGTYISNDLVQPMATLLTDENGEAQVENLSNGNYTIRIYRKGRFIMETTISTFIETNYIRTEIFHFPVWILIFSIINATFLLIGFVLYHNYKKRS